MEQVMKLEFGGIKYTIKFDKGATMNPFRVYRYTRGIGRYGYPTWNRRQLAKYADMKSCLLLIASDEVFLA